MLYQLRRADGTADPFSAGTLVDADVTTRLRSADFELNPDDVWKSPIDGTTYPARWRVRIPSQRIDVTVTPVLADQELDLTVRYWEGAVDVEGSHGGRGYLEMTGYGSS
jgi:predicted secreted hydrolase